MNFDRMKVKSKLALGFGVLSVVVFVVSGLSLKALSESNDRFSSYVHGINGRAEVVQSIRAAVDAGAIATRDLVLLTKPTDIEIEKAVIDQAQSDVNKQLLKFNEMVAATDNITQNARNLAAELNRTAALYGPVAADIVSLVQSGQRDAAVAKMNEQGRPLLTAVVKATNDYLGSSSGRAAYLLDMSQASFETERDILIGICFAAVAASVLAGLLISRSLTRALGAEPAALSEITERVAGGDLSLIAGAQQAPAGSVLASMGAMQGSLMRLISQVRAAAHGIATGSSEIAAGNLDLSSRTEEQASSLQETAASMEQLTSTVKQNAENAEQANVLATTASGVAKKGSAVVGKVVATMDEISKSSTQIADITGIIEGIAFQTNILALNAAVEAARAGEQGRGFAVVASEVRSLAQRSSSAAKEIKELIATSVGTIQNGALLANEAGKTMSEVTDAVAHVVAIMDEIAAASKEQSRGIEQVNQAVSQMDEVTQQNAALVEEATAASQSLENQGHSLTQSVALFRLEGGTTDTFVKGRVDARVGRPALA